MTRTDAVTRTKAVTRTDAVTRAGPSIEDPAFWRGALAIVARKVAAPAPRRPLQSLSPVHAGLRV